MNESDQNDSLTPDQEVFRSDGDPYRTPSEVPAESNRGWLRSPLTWFLVAGIFAGMIVMFAWLRTSSMPEYVEEFGMTRAGPPIEEIVSEPSE